MNQQFLPICRADMLARGWQDVDFVVVMGDAYVDHPSFGSAIIARLLEKEGWRVGIISQPAYHACESMKEYGRPRYGFFIGGGNVDSMVAHYSVAKVRRTRDEYSPGGVAGRRPDRSATVYTRLAKQAYPDVPVVLGGLEASLRRFAHYDYWSNTVMPSILESSGADIVSFGMSEHQTAEIARRLAAGESAADITDVAGTCFLTDFAHLPPKYAECASYKKVAADKMSYAKACRIQMDQQDPVTGLPVVQKQSEQYLVQNPPAKPLTRRELDEVHAMPFTRRYHPSYEAKGGVPAIREVEFSIIQNRGCFGGCNFCAIAMHQGRRVTSRSAGSIVAEAEAMTHAPGFKGYIHDVGGPTADFRQPSCQKQLTRGVCKNRHCLFPEPCKNLTADHSDYVSLLRKLRAIPKVKKVFIRSGVRFDYVLADKSPVFLRELVEHHISGQLRVAPEHVSDQVLYYMGKPSHQVYQNFLKAYEHANIKTGKKQYAVPYFMSSHPGCTLKEAVKLAEYVRDLGFTPEQVQDFYPTPSTLSTCMYYTGIHPLTGEKVYVPRDPHEKAIQRALMQYKNPANRQLVLEGLKKAGRMDLVGFGPKCLIRPERKSSEQRKRSSHTSDRPKSGKKIRNTRQKKKS